MSRTVSVLHVDDDPDFAELAATYLEREDDRFTVDTATNADDGLNKLADGNFDCVVSDYDMPGRSGIEFLEAVRARFPDLPFVLFTGKGSEEVASEAISAGVSDYLQKGSGAERYELLANRVLTHVERARTQRALEEREAHFRQAQTVANLGSWQLDFDDDQLYWSQGVYDIFGTSSDESLTYERFLEFVHPADRESVDEQWEAALEGAEYDIEHRIVTGDGETRWVRERADVEFDGDGNPTTALGVVQDITGRREREQELRLFREAVEVAGHSIYWTDETGEIQYANAAFEETTGYTAEEVIGENPRILKSGVQDEAVYERLWETILDGEVWRSELVNRAKDGERYVVDQTIAPVTDEDGEISHFVAVNADITERRERERELKRFRQAVEYAGHAVFITDADGTIEYVNPAFEAITGYDADEAVGRTPRILKSGAKSESYYQDLWETIREGGVWEESIENRRKSGDCYHAEQTIAPIVENGDVTAFVAIQTDISDRRNYERKLTALHDVADDLLTSGSVEHVCERTIEASRELLTFDLSVIDIEDDGTLSKMAVSENIPPEHMTDMPVEEGIAGKTYRTGEPFLIEDLSNHPEAKPQGPYESAISVPIGEHGVFQAVSGSPGAFDEADLELARLLISHAASALDRIEREERLQQQNERLSEFAQIVSHDLRNPLNVASSHHELLAEDCESDHLERIGRAHDRMDTLITDLLTLAREGDAATDLGAVDLAALSRDCWQNVDTAGATLVTDVTRQIRADAKRLCQLLENLIRNSVEHGGDDVTVRAGELEDGFYVEDDGPGIPPEERADVFETGHSTTDRGTGLGLSIVEQVVEAHGWEIDLVAAADGGTRFEITDVAFTAE